MSNKKGTPNIETQDWDSTIDNIQKFMIWFVIVLSAISLTVLILFDMLAGTGAMMFLTMERLEIASAISFATSGLLMAVMFVSYRWFNKNSKKIKNKKIDKKDFIAVLLILAVVFSVGLDVYFDSLTADYLRFGEIRTLASLKDGDVQILFRILIGSLSVVGEPLAIAMVFGMTVLKDVLKDAIPKKPTKKTYSKIPKNGSRHKPKKSQDRGEDSLIKARIEQANARRSQRQPRQQNSFSATTQPYGEDLIFGNEDDSVPWR